MLGETNGFEGILVADLFYVVTLTDTVRRYITSPEKADRVQERNPSASPKSLCHTRKKGYFPKLVGLFGYERNFSFKETLFFW